MSLAATANLVHPPHVLFSAVQWLAGGSPDGSFASPAVAASEHKNLLHEKYYVIPIIEFFIATSSNSAQSLAFWLNLHMHVLNYK